MNSGSTAMNSVYVAARSLRSLRSNYTYENFSAIRVQKGISASFPFKMFLIYLAKFTSKKNLEVISCILIPE